MDSNVSRMITKAFFQMLVFISVMLLIGCSEKTPTSENASPATGGSIALDIVMGDTWPDTEGNAVPRAMSDECGSTQFEISGVTATVYSSPAVTDAWDCSASEGTLSNVNPGNNLRLVITGYNAAAFGNITLYSGETRVNVVAGQTTPSTIVAEVFSANKIYPSQDATDIDPGGITFQWEPVTGAIGYVIELADRSDFSDPDIVTIFSQETTNTTFTYDGILEENASYYWGVFPIDIAGDSAYDTVWQFTTGTGGTLPDDEYEENDTRETAFNLTDWDGLNLSALGGYGVVTYADPDYYQITVPYDTATIEISCSFSNAQGDIDIELQNATGMVLNISDSNDDNEFIEYAHSSGSGSTYFVKVFRYDQASTSSQYDLVWYARPAAPLDVNLTHYYNMEPPIRCKLQTFSKHTCLGRHRECQFCGDQ